MMRLNSRPSYCEWNTTDERAGACSLSKVLTKLSQQTEDGELALSFKNVTTT